MREWIVTLNLQHREEEERWDTTRLLIRAETDDEATEKALLSEGWELWHHSEYPGETLYRQDDCYSVWSLEASSVKGLEEWLEEQRAQHDRIDRLYAEQQLVRATKGITE